MMNADEIIFDLSLPRHLFCMQFFNFVNSLACTHSSIWGMSPSLQVDRFLFLNYRDFY